MLLLVGLVISALKVLSVIALLLLMVAFAAHYRRQSRDRRRSR